MPRAPKDPPPPPATLDADAFPTTEEMICLPEYGGIKTPTNVQLAIARAMDGVPLGELWKDKNVKKAFGGKKPPAKPPRTMVVLAGTRCGKSILASRRLVRSAFTCSLDGLVPGDQVKVPCLATGLDTADYVYSHALACCKSPKLAASIVGRPLSASFRIARTGDVESIEIASAALSSKGSNLVGCWLGGAAFDEAPRMASEHDSVRSLKASRRSVADRLLPGGQELLIGSPYGPSGDVYELWKERFGEPDEDVIVVQTSGPMMNPRHWTPAFLELMKRTDPFVYVTSGLGEFADPPETLIPSSAVERAMGDQTEIPPERDNYGALAFEYVAALGAAERGAGWTLSICKTLRVADGERHIQQVVSRQWFNVVGSPLQSRKVIREVATLCKAYGLDYVFIHSRFVNSYLDKATAEGIGLVGVDINGDQRIELCDKLRDAVVEGRLQLTSNRQQRSDLIHVQKKPTVNGIVVQYPSSGEGVSCDFVEPLGLCVAYAPDPPEKSEEPEREQSHHHARRRRAGGMR
jgi:hypothetical protein